MAFVVKKKISGNEYYYLNESKRVDGKVKTKSLAYLGKDKKLADEKAKEIIEKMKSGEFGVNTLNNLKGVKGTSKEKGIETPIENKLDEIKRIASSRGFFFQTGNLYGGRAGFYTYGHLGKSLRDSWETLWRKTFLGLDGNFYEIQSNSILPEDVFKASGHIENFNDPMVECEKCHFRFRADEFLEDNGVKDAEALSIEEMNSLVVEKNLKCPKCGGGMAEVKQFNMMFDLNVGFGGEKSYLSPETAQGAYITFLEEFKATRGKLPLGLAIIDKAYRNEISPRQMFFRLREFSQAELQIFFDPDKINEHERWEEVKSEELFIKFSGKEEVEKVSCEKLNKDRELPRWYLYHAAKVQDFYLNVLGFPSEKFRLRELNEKERAFYNKIHFDVEIYLETLGGFKEVGGVHYRTDHDLEGHQKVSGKSMEVNIDGKKILPHILELSFGVDRNIWALLDVFCKKSKEGMIFGFPSKLSPIKAAIFPLVKNDEKQSVMAKEVFDMLKKDWNVVHDVSGSIGRRYARNDEVGTPYCITVDDDSLKNEDVTIRDRDTTKQIRVKLSKLREVVRSLVEGEIEFIKAGKVLK